MLPVVLVPVGLVFVQVAGFTRQARPESRPRYFSAVSEIKVRLCCPNSTRSVDGDPSHSLVSLWLVFPSLLRLVSSWASSARSLMVWRGSGRC
jgi:hypothetical protein